MPRWDEGFTVEVNRLTRLLSRCLGYGSRSELHEALLVVPCWV